MWGGIGAISGWEMGELCQVWMDFTCIGTGINHFDLQCCCLLGVHQLAILVSSMVGIAELNTQGPETICAASVKPRGLPSSGLAFIEIKRSPWEIFPKIAMCSFCPK